ncbi:MAG: hypothetical protein AAF215_14680 [Cyanobacteria bacterium P01_A01_bin.123]
MNKHLETLFNEPEKSYLKAQDLNLLSQYVGSLPERIKVYRQLRDKELEIMQAVADDLQQQFPQVAEASLERSIKNGLLVMRYCAMAMLLDDPAFVVQRLNGWLKPITAVYDTQAIDRALYQHLTQQLAKRFTANQMKIIQGSLILAQSIVLETQSPPTDVNETIEALAGIG